MKIVRFHHVSLFFSYFFPTRRFRFELKIFTVHGLKISRGLLVVSGRAAARQHASAAAQHAARRRAAALAAARAAARAAGRPGARRREAEALFRCVPDRPRKRAAACGVTQRTD
jgi:hypothetical protein